MKTAKKDTPGQKLFFGLLRAFAYEQRENALTDVTQAVDVTKRWMAGMSRNLRKRFADGLRKRRGELAITQETLADIAGLTATAVALIERGERAPSLDTATRLCWALDVAGGATMEDL